VEELGTDYITVEPMWNYRVIRDLVVDNEPMLMRLKEIKPYIVRDEKEIFEQDVEFGQTAAELEKYLNFAYCIECGLCYSACPGFAIQMLKAAILKRKKKL
jgi:succinate dehydrogenase / fumarate reductase iron-sulfur subunit